MRSSAPAGSGAGCEAAVTAGVGEAGQPWHGAAATAVVGGPVSALIAVFCAAPQAFSKGRASARRIYEVVDRVPVIDIHRRGPRAAARAASPAHCRGRRRFRAEFRRPVIIML